MSSLHDKRISYDCDCRKIYSVVLSSELHLLHLRPTVIDVVTFEVSSVLHLRPMITLVASTPVSSAGKKKAVRLDVCNSVNYLYV